MEEENRKTLDEERYGAISRREFMQRSAVLTGGLATVTGLVGSLAAPAVYANEVDPNDPALTSSNVKFNSTDGTSVAGYLTRPKDNVPRPAIVVIHENQGLTDHIRDVARR